MESPDYLKQPFSPPPPGVVPNFVNPHTTGQQLITTASVFLAMMIVAVLVRTYSKLRLMGEVTWDDCLCSYLTT